MRVSEFDYDLPEERIAQEPVRPRDAARLLVYEAATGDTAHLHVRDLAARLDARDLLVVNDTRVRRARLVGRRATGGAVEFLLVESIGPARWRVLARPASKLRTGVEVACEGERLRVRPVERLETGEWIVDLIDVEGGDADRLAEALGRMPLPPYIRRPRTASRSEDPRAEHDSEDYQTIFARERGAVAAPTAGLHFTRQLLAALDERGVERASVTLHVGEGTFRPVTAEDTADHDMHSEHYTLEPETVAAIERCRARGGRVVAVGTTSVRVLESCVREGVLTPGRGETRLFLTPGSRFHVVDALLTNFHLPRSTLLMLVSAFIGRERVLRLYREAVEREYRFFSYGDAMLLLRDRSDSVV